MEFFGVFHVRPWNLTEKFTVFMEFFGMLNIA